MQDHIIASAELTHNDVAVSNLRIKNDSTKQQKLQPQCQPLSLPVTQPTRQQPLNSRNQGLITTSTHPKLDRLSRTPNDQQTETYQRYRGTYQKNSEASNVLSVSPSTKATSNKDCNANKTPPITHKKRLPPPLELHKADDTPTNGRSNTMYFSQLDESSKASTSPALETNQFAHSRVLPTHMSLAPQLGQQVPLQIHPNNVIAIKDFQRLQSERLNSPFIAANYPHLIPGSIGVSNLVRFDNGVHMAVNGPRPLHFVNPTMNSGPPRSPIYKGDPVPYRSEVKGNAPAPANIPFIPDRFRINLPQLRATISAANGSITLTWDYEDPTKRDYSKVSLLLF